MFFNSKLKLEIELYKEKIKRLELENRVQKRALDELKERFLNDTIERKRVLSENDRLKRVVGNQCKDTEEDNQGSELANTDVKDLPCSTALRNILRGFLYKNPSQKFKTVFKLLYKEEIMRTRGMGVKRKKELLKLMEKAELYFSLHTVSKAD
ncbi:MAG: hypothetical protein ACPGRW_06395 [Flavobacteriaceae bacterium]